MTIKANVEKRNSLIQQATDIATELGHTMGQWNLYGLNVAMSFCQKCKRQGFIDSDPKNNRAEIYGTVIVDLCRGKPL